MLEQLVQRLQQSQDAVKIIVQGSQLSEEKLSADVIASKVEEMLEEGNLLCIDDLDLLTLEQAKEMKVRLIELEQTTLNENAVQILNGLKNMDYAVVYIESSADFAMQEYYRILDAIQQCCHEDATIIMGSRLNNEARLSLFVLAGYGEIKSNKPILVTSNDYDENTLLEYFIEELRQNPDISIATLQRKYELGFSRTASCLAQAREQLKSVR